MLPSRRGFLVAAAAVMPGVAVLARAGQGSPGSPASPASLDQFASKTAQACKTKTLTPPVPPDATFQAGSPLSTSIAPAGAASGTLTLSGTVSGLACGAIKGATIDFWQADAAGRLGAATLRGHQLTAADGTYHLATVMPGAAPGRARRIGVNVRVPGKANFWTAVFFSGDPGNAHDPAYRPDLAVNVTKAGAASAASFDVVLDL